VHDGLAGGVWGLSDCLNGVGHERGRTVGFRVRKSFKLAPGVRMTVTPRGIGVSGGVKGARVSAHSSGRVTRTVGIPGSGISHTKTISSGRSRSSTGHASSGRAVTPGRTPPASVPDAPPPGVFAPKWEKALHTALIKSPNVNELPKIAADHEQARPIAALFEVVQGAVPAGNFDRARSLTAWLHGTGFDPSRDPFITKYLPGAAITLGIAEGIEVQLPLDRNTIGLLLAELHQRTGDLAAAVDVVEQLEPTTITAVSLAELYAEQGRWDDVVGLTNDDEAATFLLIQRGIALREQGYYSASREALKEALRVRTRPAELRQMALVERGQAYFAEGKLGMARKDFERVLADNSGFPGLKEHLTSLGAAPAAVGAADESVQPVGGSLAPEGPGPGPSRVRAGEGLTSAIRQDRPAVSIQGYGIDVDYDGQTIRVHPHNKAVAVALAGQDHGQDVVISRAAMADIRFKDANALVNGNLTICTTDGKKFQLHFRKKHRDNFKALAAQLGAL
jgi:tetratricopeptide (TPR) repeat protein